MALLEKASELLLFMPTHLSTKREKKHMTHEQDNAVKNMSCCPRTLRKWYGMRSVERVLIVNPTQLPKVLAIALENHR